jgi:hypothetical protein
MPLERPPGHRSGQRNALRVEFSGWKPACRPASSTNKRVMPRGRDPALPQTKTPADWREMTACAPMARVAGAIPATAQGSNIKTQSIAFAAMLAVLAAGP